MPSPPSPPSGNQRLSLRWDAAQRACRDNDLKTLRLLVAQGGLFEDLPALRDACLSGAWGAGTASPEDQSFSTTDSIRLSTLLQVATTRGHVRIIRFLLDTFPAKDLHVLEWEIIVNAIATGSIEVLEPFLNVDPGLVNMYDQRFGTSFTVLFDLVSEREQHLPIVQLLCTRGADVTASPNIFHDCVAKSSPVVLNYLESFGKHLKTDAELLEIAAASGNEHMELFLRARISDVK